MTMTRDKIAELKRKAGSAMKSQEIFPDAKHIVALDPHDLDSLLALAERALEPQGQALPELPEPFNTVYDDIEHVEVPCYSAAQMRAYASQLALPAGPVHDGYVLMPTETTEEMLKAVYPLHWWDSPGKKLAADYKKLVAAAPKPPTVGDAEPMNAKGLKCCPFCGDMGVHAERIDSHWWGVHCPNGDCPSCSLWLAKEKSEKECIRQFNRRAPRFPPSPAVAQPVADEGEDAVERALKYIDDILYDAQQQNLFGGVEDSSGEIQCGQVDWDELRESIHAQFRKALCQPAEEGGKS